MGKRASHTTEPTTHHPRPAPVREIETRSLQSYIEWSHDACYPGTKPSLAHITGDASFKYRGRVATLGPLSFRQFESVGLNARIEGMRNRFFRLVLALSGEQRLWVDQGDAVLDMRTYLLIPPGANLNFACTTAPRKTLIIDLDPEYVLAVIADAIGHPLDALPEPAHFLFSAAALRPVQKLLGQWGNSLKRDSERKFSEQSADAIARTLILTTMPQWFPALAGEMRVSPMPDRQHPAITKSIAYMHTHYPEDISLDRLSEISGMNKFGLCRLFKRVLGTTPARHLYRIRLDYAFERLKVAAGGEQTVTEIAFATGFEDLSHFSRLFRKRYGISPITVLRRSPD